MSKSEKPGIDEDRLQDSSELLRALAHPLRMRILGFIDQHEMINVNKIYNTLKLEQSITSQHLRILRAAGLVATEREGKFIHYRVNYGRLKNALSAVRAFLQRESESEGAN